MRHTDAAKSENSTLKPNLIATGIKNSFEMLFLATEWRSVNLLRLRKV